MRIAFVSWEFPPQFGGGIGTYVAAMSRILARRGHQVTVITVGSERYPTREHVDGLEIIRLPLPVGHGPEPVGSLRCWQARSDAVHELLARMRSLDVIEFADYRGEGVTYLAATTPGKRPFCVVKLHTALNVLNRYNRSRIPYHVLESYEEQALLAADRVVSPSTALIREAKELVPRLGDIDLLPYAADPAFLEHPLSSGEPGEEILYVGRLEERKGVETLIQAAPAILDACPGATLHLVGGDLEVNAGSPSMKARLVDALPRAFRSRVIFHGPIPRERLVDRYLRARVCVFPSLFENFPNTCLEAMSLGRPVVGTDNSGMAEMIEDGVSGRISRSGDADDLARVVSGLYLLSAAEREAMGLAARERIRSEYHPETIARRFEALYNGYIQDAPLTRRVVPAAPAVITHSRCTGQGTLQGAGSSGDVASSGRALAAEAACPTQVAVVIPCYNHGQFIGEALASIRAQDWPNVGCIVVDDGSTEAATHEALRRIEDEGIQVIRQENQGLAAARNTGIRASEAEFYVALDADDRIAPDFISRLLPPLLDDPTLGYCYSHVQFFGAASGVWQCEAYDPRKLLVQNLSVATAVVRRAAFELAGGYNRDMVHGFEDWDFWLALLSAGYHGRCVPEPLFFYRKHPPGQSMLDKTQRHRAEMVQQIVRHHRTLFASMLEVSMPDKDAMFFEAHLEAHQLREAVATRPGNLELMQDELYRSLAAQAQLEHIENSRSWRLIQRLKHTVLYRAYACCRYGRGWHDAAQAGTPPERLQRILQSRSYRLIQAIKRTPLYRWYARRRYGPDFETARSETRAA